MCNPVLLGVTSLAVAGAQSGIGLMQTGAANRANEKQFQEVSAVSNEQVVQQYESLQLRNVVDEGESTLAIQSAVSQLEEAKGIAIARAADSGVAGASVAALLQEFERDAGEAVALEQRNRKLRRAQLIGEQESLATRTRAALLGATPQVVQPPDIVGALGEGLLALGQGFAKQRREDARSNLSLE